MGNGLTGWKGERWLNISSANVRSIMTARIQLAAQKGCDGIDPDNVDGYVSKSFSIHFPNAQPLRSKTARMPSSL